VADTGWAGLGWDESVAVVKARQLTAGHEMSAAAGQLNGARRVDLALTIVIYDTIRDASLTCARKPT